MNSFHPSAQQKQASYMNVEFDVEKRLQAMVAKDGIRIKEFFIDFDKLRKGYVGEAAVSTNFYFQLQLLIYSNYSSEPVSELSTSDFSKTKSSSY